MAVEESREHVDNAEQRLVAEPNTILLGLVGSTVHGVTVDSADDRDEMGICIEPPEYVAGLRVFEQWVYRTQPEGARSGPGDVDRTVYSLRKWCRLALAGNPTVMLLLHVPDDQCSVLKEPGRELRANKHWFASRRAGHAYLGYMQRQRDRMTGERGQMRVNRPELIEQYGFDTKYAGHVLRLGYQGIEFLENGRLTLPMHEPERTHVLDVRNGRFAFEDVLAEADDLQHRLEDLLQNSQLPAQRRVQLREGRALSRHELALPVVTSSWPILLEAVRFTARRLTLQALGNGWDERAFHARLRPPVAQ